MRPPGSKLREPVRLLMHLNEGFTQVLLERTEGIGMADGGIRWDIPTELIPPDLRAIGSRFVVTMRLGDHQEPHASGLELAKACREAFHVERIGANKTYGYVD
jgi:hypothetical protein